MQERSLNLSKSSEKEPTSLNPMSLEKYKLDLECSSEKSKKFSIDLRDVFREDEATNPKSIFQPINSQKTTKRLNNTKVKAKSKSKDQRQRKKLKVADHKSKLDEIIVRKKEFDEKWKNKQKKDGLSTPALSSSEESTTKNNLNFNKRRSSSIKKAEFDKSQVFSLKERLLIIETELQSAKRSLLLSQQVNVSLREVLRINENARIAMNEQLQRLKGNLRVFCRVKPTVGGNKGCIDVPPQGSCPKQLDLISGGTRKPFYFERVFESESKQGEIFEEVEGFVQSAFDGNQVTIFAYGQTCAGKTFTLLGDNNEPGVIPRALEKLVFEKETRGATGEFCELLVSCLEVYNEKVLDLLAGGEPKESRKKAEDPFAKLGLAKESIESVSQGLKLLNLAQAKRSTDSTAFNSASSRSHLIFRVEIRREEKVGKLTIVDLAGSEGASPSQNEKVAAEKAKKIAAEGGFINKSLTTLGRILRLVKEKKRNGGPINLPVREAKLTQLLQDSFQDGAFLLLFLNVCQEDSSFRQTKESLNFGNLGFS